jgi:hypothetical protein
MSTAESNKAALKGAVKLQLIKFSNLVPRVTCLVFVCTTAIIFVQGLMSLEYSGSALEMLINSLKVAIVVSFIAFFIIRTVVHYMQKTHIKQFAKKRELKLQKREEELAIRYRKLQNLER